MFQLIRISFLILIYLLLPIPFLLSQNQEEETVVGKIDTTYLKQRITNQEIPPEEKISILLKLAEELGNTDMNKRSQYAKEAYSLAHQMGDSLQKGDAARILGVSYAIQGVYGEAAKLFTESYNLAIKFGTQKQQTVTLVNLGGIYFIQDDWENCLLYSRKALANAARISDNGTVAATHEAMGLVFLNTHQLDSSEYHFRKAIDLYKILGKKREMANAMSSFSGVYQEKKQYQQAINQLQQAESIFQREDGNKLSSQQVSALLNRAAVRFLMNDFQAASTKLNLVIETSKQQGLLNYLVQAYRIQSRIDSALQNFSSSLAWMNKYIIIKDSIAALDKESKLEATMAFYESKSKDDAVTLLNSQNELAEIQLTNQRVTLGVVLLALFILALLTAELIRRNRQVRLTNQRLANKQRVIQKKNQNLEEVGRQLMTQKSELEELNQTKDRWFGVISHDFRHPLTVLHGALDLIIEDDLSPQERRSVFADIQKRLSRTSYLLDNLLFWAQHQMDGWKANYESMKIDELLLPVIDVVEGWAKEKSINFECICESKFQIQTDPEAIRLVIRNLLSNSIKYSFPGQTIIIRALELEGEWRISVTDHGVGMTEEQIESIFGSGQRSTLGTHNEKGSGLGLSLCRDFVNFLGGSLKVESEPERKTTFTLRLPKGGDQKDDYIFTDETSQRIYSK